MKKDIFLGKSGTIISVIAILVVLSTWMLPVRQRNWLWTIFFLTYAALNFLNYKNLKHNKDLIISVGFIITFIISLLNTLFLINIRWFFVWLVGLIAIILGALFKTREQSSSTH